MLNNLKRYGMAFVFLSLVILLMLGSTLLVKSFGDDLFEDANITIKPKGERIVL